MDTISIILIVVLAAAAIVMTILYLTTSTSLRKQLEAKGTESELIVGQRDSRIAELDNALKESQQRIEQANQLNEQRIEQANQLSEQRQAAAAEQIERDRQKATEQAVRIAQLEAQIEKLTEKAASDKQQAEQMQERMRVEFKNLANDILNESSKQLKQTNSESIELILKPLRDNIKDFRERVESIHTDQTKDRTSLQESLKNLTALNKQVTEQTNNLTDALKGNSKVQGDFGEMILTTILEQSGLQQGVHYLTQQNYKNEEGRNVRPDVVLLLPEKKSIIIDSKVSLTAYVDAVAAETNDQRLAALQRHVNSVRSHINELAAKSYQDLTDTTPDFVIMFVANEPAFLSAIQTAPQLWEEAYNKKVIITSPTNMFALLKIVDDLWKRDNQSRNALAIATEGGKLYDRFVDFTKTLLTLKKNIDSAAEGCDKAISQLSSGNGNLVRRTENLRKLGAKASKQMLLEPADDDDSTDELTEELPETEQ